MNILNYYEGDLSHIIDFRCDQVFAQAIEVFHEQANSSNHYLGTKRNSIFSLVKTTLDPAFKKAYKVKIVSGSNQVFIYDQSLLPSSLMKLPHGYGLNTKEESTSGYERCVAILEKWVDHLEFLENLADGPVETGMVLTLRKLALHLKHYKPKEKYLPLSKDFDELIRTQGVRKKAEKYCRLCWRETERYSNNREGLYVVDWRASAKFCSNHLPLDGFNTVYQRDHRLKGDFQNEILSELNPGTSSFLPNFSWFANYFPGLSVAERRKLAYRLVHSKLNSKSKKEVRKKILSLLSQGASKAVICEEVNLAISSLNRHIIAIKKEITWILSWPFLNPDGSKFQGDPSVRRFKRCSLSFKYIPTRNDATRLLIQQCYHKLPGSPSWDSILNAVSESLDF